MKDRLNTLFRKIREVQQEQEWMKREKTEGYQHFNKVREVETLLTQQSDIEKELQQLREEIKKFSGDDAGRNKQEIKK